MSHALVLEIQRLRAAGEVRASDVLVGRLLNACLPLLTRIARRFSPKARGSLELEDLEQVGAIEALKLLERYDGARGGPGAFEALLWLKANRACMDQIRLHAQSIRPSDADQRRGVRRPTVERFDEQHAPGTVAPDTILEREQTRAVVRRAVGRLPPSLGAVVRAVHGIGQPRRSVRDLAQRTRTSRGRVTEALRRGELALRGALTDAA